MEYCSHVWPGAPNRYLDMLDKPQKHVYRTVGPCSTLCPEPLAHCRNVANFSIKLFSIGITLVDFHLDWLNWFHCLIVS